MKSSPEEHKKLRDRLCPVAHDEYVQPVKVTTTKLEIKTRKDSLTFDRELKEINDYFKID